MQEIGLITEEKTGSATGLKRFQALQKPWRINGEGYNYIGNTYEVIKSEPIKALRPHRIDFKHGYSVDRYKLIGKAMEALKNDSGAFEW